MNWDATSAIAASAIINSILVAVLVAITAFYAREVRRQTAVMVQEGEKNKILEEVQDVLTPTIHFLEEEIEAIEENKIWWHRYTSGRCDFQEGLAKLIGSNSKGYSGAARDVFREL